jgi:aminopeptidase N/disulfide bond formation protein DsbB
VRLYPLVITTLGFFAIVTFVAGLALLAGVMLPSSRKALIATFEDHARHPIGWAWGLALIATSSSLYLSEVVGLVPCSLCWYQRFMMYPLVLVLGFALLRGQVSIWRFGLPLSVVGLAISIYHTSIQWQPALDVGACTSGVPCSGRYVAVFGVISIPTMAGSVFLAVTALLLLLWAIERAGGRPSTERPAPQTLSGVLSIATLALTSIAAASAAPVAAQTFTRADTLRGSNGPDRAWWDVAYYDLEVSIDPSDSTIAGTNRITYAVLTPGTGRLQIDLQPPMRLDSVTTNDGTLRVVHDGSAHFVELESAQRPGARSTVAAHFSGRPTIAANPPWDGGFIWAEQADDGPWVATANQGLGASVWWPNKDFQGEEPDSQRIAMTVPDGLMDVSNGRLRSVRENGDGTSTWEWFVSSPINNYGIAVNVGSFAHWQETYHGLEGPLTLDFYPLAENEQAARAQWRQTQPMMRCFEEWFGPYPWYEDGFKMIESPHLGMEHQSAIAYGNGYQNGYEGTDLSGTGQGDDWDFIIIHETAHEWWGNNITTEDVADMWVHESFASYSENLYVECLRGSAAAGAEYVIGARARVQNDRPVVGSYGVQNPGSGDMYYKGSNMLHTIRQLVGDDARWKSIMRGLNRDFRHSIVTGAQVEAYIARHTRLDLEPVFEQYLRTTTIPVLEWLIEGTELSYQWTNAVSGFDMPIPVTLGAGGAGEPAARITLPATEAWQTVTVPPGTTALEVDPDYYVTDRARGR